MHLLDQVERNIGQGELGQSLAQGKLDAIKADFSEISSNIVKETQMQQKMRETEKKESKDGIPSIDDKFKTYAQIAQASTKLSEQFDTVVDLEKQLNRDCKGVEVADSLAVLPEFKDDEILTMKIQMNKSVADLKNFLTTEQGDIKKQKEEAEERASSAGTANHKRTDKDKDEMAAFLAGDSF